MKKNIFFAIVFSIFLLQTNAQQNTSRKDSVPLLHGAHRINKRIDADMQRWREYGLGQFIHFGLYSIFGGEYNGEYYNGASEWIRSWNKLPHDVYDSSYHKFNPVNFNADKWASMAKQMGVRYVTITTKHHDGFCIWPTKYTYFNISSTPYKKDIIGPLVDAYNKQGIDVYLYFSIMDWHNPDWRYDLKTADDTIAFNRFKLFVKNQLTELLTLYPKAKGLWFDGTWDKSWQKSGAFTDSLEQYLKQMHPGLIIGSRLRADDFGNRHFDANGHLMGDYEQGWERNYPKTFAETRNNDWDCIMTIPENGWGYQKKWLGHWKTLYEILEMMSICNSLNGNFVLNFGPKSDGTFREEEVKIAKQISGWMKINNSAVYAVKYTGLEKQDWGYYAQSVSDTSKIYMTVYNIPISRKLKIVLPQNTIVTSAQLISDGKQLATEKLDYGNLYIKLPDENFTHPFVIQLDIQKGKTDRQKKNLHV